MAENKLPHGVGKKIVQALKKQADIEIKTVPDEVVTAEEALAKQTQAAFSATVPSDDINLDEPFNDFSGTNGFFNDTESVSINNFDSNPVEVDSDYDASSEFDFDTDSTQSFAQEETFNPQNIKLAPPPKPKNHSMPSNVSVLKRLIAQLPGGVTKQTGAQIIRQTMEALGISMNSVLKEAQQVQDSLNDSARTCMISINEYKNCIRSLEKQVQDYKKQAVSLNDLISLFVMTDKH